METTLCFAPIASSEAGACLTAANYQEVGISALVYRLDSLLVKPGVATLRQLDSLKTYLGWSGQLILDAQQLRSNKEGHFTVISAFDGAKQVFKAEELLALIGQLPVDALILPRHFFKNNPGVFNAWQNPALVFLDEDDLPLYNGPRKGVYAAMQELDNLALWSERHAQLPRYLITEATLPDTAQVKSLGIDYLASDKPAALAFEGKVYSKAGLLELTSQQFEKQFEVIENDCGCPTCKQQLTKAYLHHLLANTPLLCQRFLIQHNLWYYQQ